MVQVQLPLPFSLGPLVKRSRHRPFTAVTGVRFPHGSPLGSLAQLGEHLPYKQRVSGSSPLTSTTKTTHESEWFFFLSLETAGFPGRASCVGNTSYPDGSFFQHRLSGVLELRKRVRLFPGGRFFAEIQRENAPSADGESPAEVQRKTLRPERDEHACAVRVPRAAGAEKCCPDRANRLRGSCIPAGRCRNSLRCG